MALLLLKGTGATALFFTLIHNRVEIVLPPVKFGNWIIDVVNGVKSEVDLAAWLRDLAKQA